MTKEELLKLIKEIAGNAVKEVIEEQYKKQISGFAYEPRKPENTEKGINAARIIRALAAGRGDPDRARLYAKKAWGEDSAVFRALDTQTGDGTSGGGYLIPEEFSSEVIELLYANTVVRKLGAVSIPMDTGTLNMSTMTAGANAYYITEGSNITASNPGFGQITLSWKKLAVLVPISNDLLRFSSPKADAIVRDDLVRAMSLKEDQAFIRGTGTAGAPKGIRYWVDSNNIETMTSSPTAAKVLSDLLTLVGDLKDNDAPMAKCAWVFHPRVERYLLTLQDSTSGEYPFKDEMLKNKTILGFPYATTTQIPTNLGDNSNETEVYFVDFSECLIGESSTLIIDASGEAAYYDGNNVVSAFSLDQTVLRAIARHDFALRHTVSAAVLTGVTWGA